MKPMTPLRAYLASALTGLNPEQRQLVFLLSDVVAGVCQEFEINLYEPRKMTDPVHHPTVSDTDVFRIDRERVLESDLVIFLAAYPSTGAGMELDFALTALIPVIVIRHEETRLSRMITGIPARLVEVSYSDPCDLRIRLRNVLASERAVMAERRTFLARHDSTNLIGARVRSLREARGLSREELAQRSPYLTVEVIQSIEESGDLQANPSLFQLVRLAESLNTVLHDLIC